MEQLKTTIYNYRVWVSEWEPAPLAELLRSFLEEAGYCVLNFSEHHFEPQGYTCFWLLAESHLALHTFPEEERSYIELSGCSEISNRKFVDLVQSSADLKVLSENQSQSH